MTNLKRWVGVGAVLVFPLASFAVETSVSTAPSRAFFAGDLNVKLGFAHDPGINYTSAPSTGVLAEVSAIFPSGFSAEVQLGTLPNYLAGAGYVLRKNNFMLKFKGLLGVSGQIFGIGPGTNADLVFGPMTLGVTASALFSGAGSSLSMGALVGFLF